jgi:hypothetical protein
MRCPVLKHASLGSLHIPASQVWLPCRVVTGNPQYTQWQLKIYIKDQRCVALVSSVAVSESAATGSANWRYFSEVHRRLRGWCNAWLPHGCSIQRPQQLRHPPRSHLSDVDLPHATMNFAIDFRPGQQVSRLEVPWEAGVQPLATLLHPMLLMVLLALILNSWAGLSVRLPWKGGQLRMMSRRIDEYGLHRDLRSR